MKPSLHGPRKAGRGFALCAVFALCATAAISQERTTSQQNETRAAEIEAIRSQSQSTLLNLPAERAAKQDTRIIGGTDASATGQWEFTVNLRLRGSGRCGGVLISPDIRGAGDDRHVVEWRSGSARDLWVLTAAHCLYDGNKQPFTKDEIEVRAGTLDLQDANIVSFDVIEPIPHPNYKAAENFVNDIALLRVEPTQNLPVPNAKPRSIKLPDFRDFQTLYQPSVRFQVNGWGITDSGNVTDYLQTADIPYLDQEECFRNYMALYGGLPAGAFCAGWIEGGIDSCGGDSGGPIFFPGSVGPTPYSNDPILTGLVSWGRGCALPGFPGIYTNVFSHLSWIEKHVVVVN